MSVSVTSTAPTRGFDQSEFEARTEKAQGLMRDHGLAALFLTTEPEVRYFTGFHTPFWLSPTRPWFLVVPARGKPIAVIPSIGTASMSATWLDDIRTWPAPRPEDDGISLLAETLAEVTGRQGRVGVPMGHETHVRMPARDFDRLRDVVGAEFVDATAIVRAQRMIKSEAEIEKIAYICDVASGAFEGFPALVSSGDTDRGAFARMRISLLQRGADEVPFLVGNSGPGGFSDVITQGSGRTLEDGDLLVMDTGAMFDGYFCDFDRNFAFGHASDEAKRAYTVVHDATTAGLAAARPGASCAELWRAMGKVMSSGARGSDVGRLGHGLGMQLTEWPSHTPHDTTVLAEGMVLTLEPGMTYADGKLMLHEENIVIREDGAELLTRRAPPELPIIE